MRRRSLLRRCCAGPGRKIEHRSTGVTGQGKSVLQPLADAYLHVGKRSGGLTGARTRGNGAGLTYLLTQDLLSFMVLIYESP